MKQFLFALLLLSGFQVMAQGPVSWTFELIQDDGGQAIKATAVIDKDWVVYSPYTEEGGPIPTSISLEGVELVGDLREEGELIEDYSDLFEINVSKFKKEVSFIQAFKADGTQKELKGYVRFMTCNGVSCLPPKNIDFSLEL